MKNALREALLNAKHYKAVGITELSVGKYGQIDDDPPWHLATSCEPGGSHRLDISTSVWFKGKDPESGLNLRWSFDIEPNEANGTGSYQIDTRACEDTLRLLPRPVALEFRKYLADCAEKVMKRALEYQGYADRQYKDAQTLTLLAGSQSAAALQGATMVKRYKVSNGLLIIHGAEAWNTFNLQNLYVVLASDYAALEARCLEAERQLKLLAPVGQYNGHDIYQWEARCREQASELSEWQKLYEHPSEMRTAGGRIRKLEAALAQIAEDESINRGEMIAIASNALGSASETETKPDQWVQDGKVWDEETELAHQNITYPCGCTASGPGPLPSYCSVHSVPNRREKQ